MTVWDQKTTEDSMRRLSQGSNDRTAHGIQEMRTGEGREACYACKNDLQKYR
jgi:hypothetical protein